LRGGGDLGGLGLLEIAEGVGKSVEWLVVGGSGGGGGGGAGDEKTEWGVLGGGS